MKKTKIVATIGPASSDIDTLRAFVLNGVNCMRLNMAYASYNFCKEVIDKINIINRELNTYVSIMLDLKGPVVRVGRFIGGSASLKKGEHVRIFMEDVLGDCNKFSVSYPSLNRDVDRDQLITLDDGRISMKVVEKDYDSITCLILNDGIIEDQKSLNVPGVKLSLPFLSRKDMDDILFAHQMKVDFLAVSFATCAEHILKVNDKLIELGNDHISILSKIENERAVQELDEILRVSDGVIVARGDLGVEIPLQRVPMIQKAIISKCHEQGKISIVSTEMLSSMEQEIRPTRAEVSDVANAVLDGVDAIMLTGETTRGKHPVMCVDMMAKIMESTEEDINYFELLDKAMRTEKQDTTGVLSYSVAECASRLKCFFIITPTFSGYTVRKISRFRPNCMIVALSPNVATLKSLSLYFGVIPMYEEELNSLDRLMKKARMLAIDWFHCSKGDKIIITGGYPFKEVHHTNLMKIEEI